MRTVVGLAALLVVLPCLAGAAGTATATPAAIATPTPTPSALERAQEVYRREGPKAALPLFEAVRRAAEDRREPLAAAIAEGYVGNCHKRLGDYPKARQHLERALAAKRRLGARLEAGKSLNHLGLLLWESGDLKAALARFEEAIAVAQAEKDERLEAAVLNNTALVLDEQGQLTRSRERYDRALVLFRGLGDRESEAAALGNIGGVHYFLGDFRQGIDFHGQALAIHRELGQKPAMSKDLANIALCHTWLDELPQALALLDQAIALATEAGLEKEAADFRRFRSSALARRGDFSEALAALREALAVYQKAGMRREEVEAHVDLAHLRLELGEMLASRDELLAAAATSEKEGYARGAFQSLRELGELALLARNPKEAAGYWTRALERARTAGDKGEEAEIRLRLSRAAQELGDRDAARAQLRESLALARKLGLAGTEAEVVLAEAEEERRAGRPAASLERAERAIALLAPLAAPERSWPAEHSRGRALEALGRREEAVQAYRAAVDAIEKGRSRLRDDVLRAGYLERRAAPYADLARLLLELGRLGEAFREIERGRARTQLDLVGREGLARSADASTPRRAEEHELRRKIERLHEQLAAEQAETGGSQREAAVRGFSHELTAAERRYSLLLAELRAEDPAYVAMVATSPAGLVEVQAGLGTDEALIEYFLAPETVHALVVTKTAISHESRPLDTARLKARVDLLRDRIALGGEDWRRPAEALWDLLVAPALVRVPQARRLYLVPQGALHDLPFAALRERGAGARPHLIERHELVTLPSASVLTLLRARQQPVAGARAHAGAPAAGRGGGASALALAPGISGLTHAPEEARTVERLLGGRALVGAGASEAECKARAGGYEVLHLATHGRLNAANPLFSHVVLEPGAGEDGRLNVFEILDLRLQAGLVTLSACSTAVGVGYFRTVPEGDERVSLTRAFLEAGAASVAATLWEVDDRAAIEVMRRFYARLADLGRSAALARAQRELASGAAGADLAHPRAWAGFVLVGDGG